MPVIPQETTEQTDSVPSPATHPSWRFGELSAAELMPQLQRHLLNQDEEANWQLVWLNNDGQPVIGLLPKVSWSVYPTDVPSATDTPNMYKVIKRCRATGAYNSTAVTVSDMSYLAWQNALIAYGNAYTPDSDVSDNAKSNTINQKSGNPRYHHGLIGFIGYDIAAYELSPAANIERAAQPCAVLGHYDIYLTPDDIAGNRHWQLMTNAPVHDSDNRFDDTQIRKTVTTLSSYLDTLDKKLSNNALHKTQPEQSSNSMQLSNPQQSSNIVPVILKARWHKRDYQQAFDRTQDYLQQGDCYQINLTQKWSGDLACADTNNPAATLIDYLPALHRNTQAPFAGYLSIDRWGVNRCSIDDVAAQSDIDNHRFELLSCSPELFFTFSKDSSGKHRILTKPIKGTMPRGNTDKQDEGYKQQLINSEKDRAENVMIVDLLRNDLGKYAKIGSVKVPQLFAIESFSNVHHMVSTITAELKTDTHPLAVLFGSLPAGSITGTPKKRAVEIISELEGAPRGAYCGTMGYMNFDGSGQWNVLIRTLQASASLDHGLEHGLDNGRHISLWAGGGITVASDCDAEYQECLDKVGNLLSVLAQENLSK